MKQRLYKPILALIAIFSSISIYAYEPMIREDRIWEYRWLVIDEENSAIHHDQWLKIIPINFKFEGTEDINGFTYHKLLSWFPNEEDQKLQTVALMREGNNRVYLLLQDEDLFLESPFTMAPNNSTVPLKINIEANEILLYDFSSKNEQRYPFNEIYNNCTDIVTTAREVMFNDLGPMDAELSLVRAYYKSSTLENQGKEWNVRQFAFTEEKAENLELPKSTWEVEMRPTLYSEIIVEGVGNVFRGLLHRPFMNAIFYPTSSGSFLATEHIIYFARQMDLEGNIIFNAPWVEGSGVEEVAAPGQETDGESYDLSGKRVVNPEPGTIYIQDGKKHIAH